MRLLSFLLLVSVAPWEGLGRLSVFEDEPRIRSKVGDLCPTFTKDTELWISQGVGRRETKPTAAHRPESRRGPSAQFAPVGFRV